MKKGRKKGTGYFFWEKENCFYLQTFHIEKVACPLFYLKKRKRDENREAIKYSI